MNGTAKVTLFVEAGVCDCPGGPARWSLSQYRSTELADWTRFAECLGCGRRWMKRVAKDHPTEDEWRAIPAVEVH